MTIVSHRHRFIFIKTRKTAGTSIEIALSTMCGDEDIIGRLGPRDESLRREYGGVGPQHYHVPFRRYALRDWARLLRYRRRRRYTQHMAARSLRKRLTSAEWGEYFKFCFERNPWDKAISLYYWRTCGMSSPPDLIEFLREVEQESLSNWALYTVADEVVVDHMAKYEDLEAELGEIRAHLGLERIELPRAKGGVREDRRSYRDVLGSAGRQLVARRCRREIDHFGYEF